MTFYKDNGLVFNRAKKNSRATKPVPRMKVKKCTLQIHILLLSVPLRPYFISYFSCHYYHSEYNSKYKYTSQILILLGFLVIIFFTRNFYCTNIIMLMLYLLLSSTEDIIIGPLLNSKFAFLGVKDSSHRKIQASPAVI